MSNKPSKLRFNFGFLLEASVGTIRVIELDYPSLRLDEETTLTPLTGRFQATRTSNGIYVEGTLHSTAVAECARCLTDVMLPVEMKLGDLFFYPPYTAPAEEPAVGEDGFIDLAPLVRELSLLEIPLQAVCHEACRGLCPTCGANLNEGDCDCEPDEIDPRLATLRILLDP